VTSYDRGRYFSGDAWRRGGDFLRPRQLLLCTIAATSKVPGYRGSDFLRSRTNSVKALKVLKGGYFLGVAAMVYHDRGYFPVTCDRGSYKQCVAAMRRLLTIARLLLPTIVYEQRACGAHLPSSTLSNTFFWGISLLHLYFSILLQWWSHTFLHPPGGSWINFMQ
jgi:hypothetical protein